MLRLFLSYRRDDTAGKYLAHMIYRELRRRYGEGSAFLDVDARSPGLSFPKKVKAALDGSDAVLVVIGPEWLNQLKSRLNDERDWVRYEVSESLKRPNLPVVPVCHGTTSVPPPQDLPAELQELAWRDGVALDPFVDFDAHLARLLADLERSVQESRDAATQVRQSVAEPPPAAAPALGEAGFVSTNSPPAPAEPKPVATGKRDTPKVTAQEALQSVIGWLKSDSTPAPAPAMDARYGVTAATMRGLGFSKEEVKAYLTSIGATADETRIAVGSAYGRGV